MPDTGNQYQSAAVIPAALFFPISDIRYLFLASGIQHPVS